MGKCLYKYKGKEYTSKEDLLKIISSENSTNSPAINRKFEVKGDLEDLQIQESLILQEAQIQYGTSEMIETNYKDGTLVVSIDGQAIEDLNSNEKLLFNNDTGKLESFNIEELVQKEKDGLPIPSIENWKEVKVIHFSDKVVESAISENIAKTESVGLKRKLVDFATKLGISITTMEEYMKNRKLRDGMDVLDVKGLADIFERIIALANKNNVDVLTEEVAHFAIEFNLDQDIIQKMLAKVHETDTYKKESEKYRIKYGKEGLTGERLEQKVRKEILGKILAEKVKDNFDKSESNSTEIGITTQLQKLWNRLLDVFKINDGNRKFFREFGATLDNIANDVLDGNDKSFHAVDSREVYYSMSGTSQDIHDRLAGAINDMEFNYKNTARDNAMDATKKRQNLDIIREGLVDHKYSQILNAWLSVLQVDINNAFFIIQKAKAAKTGTLYDNIGKNNVNAANIMNFLSNYSYFADVLENQISELSGVLSDVERAHLNAVKKEVDRKFNEVRKDIETVLNEAVSKIVEDSYRKEGAPEDVIEEAVSAVKNRKFSDITSFTEHTASLKSVDNPIIKVIYALVLKAKNHVKNDLYTFANKLDALQLKYNLKESDIKKLYDKLHILNPFHMTDLMVDYNKKKEEIIEKYETKKTGKSDAEKRSLDNEKYREIYKLDLEWWEKRLKKEEYEKLIPYSKEVRDIILAKTISKYEILSKYRKKDGSINFQYISNKDFTALESIENKYKKDVSSYNEDGTKKEGIYLEIAHDLQKYQQSVINSLNKGVVDASAFEKERQSILSKYGSLSDEYRKWVAENAIETYSEEVMDKLNNQDRELDVELTFNNLTAGALLDMISGLDVNVTLTDREIINFFVDGDIESLRETIELVYDGLVEKRKQLVKPYRVKGKFNEIDGNLIQEDLLLSDSINSVSSDISKFKLTAGDMNIKAAPNQAYFKKISELKNTPELLKQFQERVGVRNGVPSAYYYRTFTIQDENKISYNKELVPNFRWEVAKSVQSKLNDNFNDALAGKTKQPNVNNKDVQKHLNTDFHSTFGINKSTDFWGLNGATSNVGLYELRKTLLDQKEKDDKKYNLYNKNYELPYVLAGGRETLVDKGIKDSFKSQFEKMFLANEHDEITGNRLNKAIPKRYIQREGADYKLLTTNVSTMYGSYTQAASNYQYLNGVLPSIEVLKNRLEKGKFGKNQVSASDSKTIRMLSKWLSKNVYGNQVTEIFEIDIPSSTKKISGAKVFKTIFNHIRIKNIAYHYITPVEGSIIAKVIQNL